MFMAFLDLLALIVSLAVSLAIVVPLSGILIRYRANYNPKALNLDSEGGATPYTGPVINNYFAMLARVWRIEGWAGLYKGFMPTFLTTSMITVGLILFADAPRPGAGHYRAPDVGIIGTLIYSFGNMLISLPSAILTCRAVTTPYKLPWLQPIKSLRVLLTPTERSRPWILYLTPGLLAAQALHIAVVVLFLGPLQRWLVPNTPGLGEDFSPVKFGIYCVVVLLSTGVLAPLEVISTRLAIQRNHASAEYNSVAQEAEGDAEEVDLAGVEEDVIGLRHEADPYVGLVDCAKRMADEEGIQTLYRAWWLTLLSGLGSAFA
ncbi:mitochondrial carrier domain-containing protein [Schizophyllum commune]